MNDGRGNARRPEDPGALAEILKVSDLQLAAYLIANAYELRGVAATPDPRRLDFILHGPAGLPRDQLIADFWQGRALVNLAAFLDAQRRLKALVHRSPRIEGWTGLGS